MKTIKYFLFALFIVMGMVSLDSCCSPSPWSEAKEIKQLPEIFPDYIGLQFLSTSLRLISIWWMTK